MNALFINCSFIECFKHRIIGKSNENVNIFIERCIKQKIEIREIQFKCDQSGIMLCDAPSKVEFMGITPPV
jgi:hypothetical protein